MGSPRFVTLATSGGGAGPVLPTPNWSIPNPFGIVCTYVAGAATPAFDNPLTAVAIAGNQFAFAGGCKLNNDATQGFIHVYCGPLAGAWGSALDATPPSSWKGLKVRYCVYAFQADHQISTASIQTAYGLSALASVSVPPTTPPGSVWGACMASGTTIDYDTFTLNCHSYDDGRWPNSGRPEGPYVYPLNCGLHQLPDHYGNTVSLAGFDYTSGLAAFAGPMSDKPWYYSDEAHPSHDGVIHSDPITEATAVSATLAASAPWAAVGLALY
ncbi:hypothetical protein [Mycobacterium avium]|uniref:hypothetical protein n=1 Tax=Mycobacterium avium TaxID=1764 RepID=UPI0011586F6E|nr:hypothetical protein [Mycobacterium avium]